jgi:hypothetical protein
MTRASKIIVGLVFLVGAGLGAAYWYAADEQPVVLSDTLDTSGWKTYRNEAFQFEIKYPPEWEMAAFPDSDIAPVFNFYKPPTSVQPPFTHHHTVVQVSVFPHGLPTEGVFGMSTPTVLALSPGWRGNDFLLDDSSVWASMIAFEDVPDSWNEAGFLWMRADVANLEIKCLRNGREIPEQECDPMFGDEIVREGIVDEETRAIEEAILSTFMFIDEPIGDERIRPDTPKANEKISSPLTVTGEARGTWYFEASFPIILEDDTGAVIGQGIAQAQEDWMTESFVPYEGTITFDRGTATSGVLILKRDNPSGLPEQDAEVRIPVRF